MTSAIFQPTNTRRPKALLVLLASLFVLGALFPARSLIVGAADACPTDKRHLVPWLGGRWYMSGVNVPWHNGGFGADFATVEERNQHTYTSASVKAMFADLQSKGVNSVRWWVFADGRGAPEFDSNSGGAVTGFDATTLPTMADAAKLAAEHDLYLVFTLWSFDMLYADDGPNGRGEHAGGHRDLIVDAAKRKSFIDKAMIPMLQYPVPGTEYTIGTHPNILGWEVINEPEWGINEAGVDGRIPQGVSLADMQRFVAEVAGAVHRNSNQTVTVGSAAMKWNSDNAPGAAGNWWKDSALTKYDPDGYLDYYQIHYYGWMNGDASWSSSPLKVTWAAGGFDKPVVVGEHPANANGTGTNTSGMLEGFHSNCYGGAWAWNYGSNDGNGVWNDYADAMGQFNSAHADEIQISGDPAPAQPPAQPTVRPPAAELTNRLYLPILRKPGR